MKKTKRFLSVLLAFCLTVISPISNVGCIIVHAESNWVSEDVYGAGTALQAFLALEKMQQKIL